MWHTTFGSNWFVLNNILRIHSIIKIQSNIESDTWCINMYNKNKTQSMIKDDGRFVISQLSAPRNIVYTYMCEGIIASFLVYIYHFYGILLIRCWLKGLKTNLVCFYLCCTLGRSINLIRLLRWTYVLNRIDRPVCRLVTHLLCPNQAFISLLRISYSFCIFNYGIIYALCDGVGYHINFDPHG